MWFFLLYAAVLLVTVYLAKFYYDRSRLPPGPFPWPLVGNFLTLRRSKRWEVEFNKWRKDYGNIFTLYLGGQPSVAFNSFELLQKTMSGDKFAARCVSPRFNELLRKGNYGIINVSGEFWAEQRQFALRFFEEFGLKTGPVEQMILHEVDYISDKLYADEKAGVEVDLIKYLDIAVGSTINSILCGYRFTDGKEDEFYQLKSKLAEANLLLTEPMVNMFLASPKLMNVPLMGRSAWRTLNLLQQIFHHLQIQVEQHRQHNDYDNLSKPKDFIDAYIMEAGKKERAGVTDHRFTDLQLTNVVFDIWLSGQETTSIILGWLGAYLIRHPEHQKRAHAELDQVIHSARPISMADSASLPFINAVCMETLRCADIFPYSIPHMSTEDTVVEGHSLKKGTVVLPMLSTLLYDPETFPEPERFDPTRFIDENGALQLNKALVPFSIGKRTCLGEGLARLELFVVVANLLNRFELLPGNVVPALNKDYGNVQTVKPYTCRVRRRI